MKKYPLFFTFFCVLVFTISSAAQDPSKYPANVRLKTIISDAKKNNQTSPVTTNELTAFATSAKNAKRFLLAMDCYTEIAKLNPTDFRPHFERGVIAMNDLKDFKSAIKDFSAALKLDATVPELYFNRGTSHLFSNNFKDAKTDFDKLLEISPKYVDGFLNRGIAKLNLKDPDGAIADLTQGITLRPNYSNLYTARALAHKMKGNEALAAADEARAAQYK